jgi:hypothetical protein
MTPDLEDRRRRPGKKDRRVHHDWSTPPARPRIDAPVKNKWPRLRVFDSYIRERLKPILARREAERAAERGLSRSERVKLWRAQSQQRRQEFADALELSLCEPFSLDVISRPRPGRHGRALCGKADLEAAFDVDSASWFSDGLGLPAMVVTQPDFETYGAARSLGTVAHVADTRGIDIITAPNELGWVEPRRSLVMWVRRAIPLDD